MSSNLDEMITSALRAQSEAVPDAGFSGQVGALAAGIRKRRKLARLVPGIFGIFGTALVLLFQVRWTALLNASGRLAECISAIQLPQAYGFPLWMWGCVIVVLFAAANSAVRTSEI